jgi:hypothetical protein
MPSRILLFLMFLALSAGVKAGDPTFPVLAGQDLHGAPFDLKARAAGKPAVLIVGFTKASSAACQRWEDRLRADRGGLTTTALVPIVVLEGAPGFVVPMILRGIRKQRPPEQHRDVLVLRSGKGALQAAVGFDPAKPDDAYVVVLDSSGALRFKGHRADLGLAADKDGYDALRLLLKKIP